MTSEKAFQRKVLEYLRKRGGWWRKSSPLPYGHTGDPDVYGVYWGRFVSIELKAPGKYKNPNDGLTVLQRAVLLDIEQSGGIVIIADKLPTIVAALDVIHA